MSGHRRGGPRNRGSHRGRGGRDGRGYWEATAEGVRRGNQPSLLGPGPATVEPVELYSALPPQPPKTPIQNMIQRAHREAARQEQELRAKRIAQEQEAYATALAEQELLPTTLMEWWIWHSEFLFPKMIERSDSKLRLYGGFALNVQLGRMTLPRVLGIDNVITQYRRGAAISGTEASDIDGKLYHLGGQKEEALRCLKSIEMRGAQLPKKSIETLQPILGESVLEDGKQYVLIQNPEPSPFQYIVGTLRTYFINQDFSNPNYQILLYGVFPDSTYVDLAQVKCIPVAKKADLPSGYPIDFESFEELNAGFAALETFLQGVPEERRNTKRLGKTTRRRQKIAEALGRGQGGAVGGTARGGGSRRRAHRRAT